MPETFISVDIEASGPIPGEYSMLSLGACVVGASDRQFYIEIAPLSPRFDPAALAVAGFNMDDLARRGTPPEAAMRRFEEWLGQVTPDGQAPIFVGYPVSFDFMFVAYYFHRFLGHNPFGHAALDIRSYYAGMMGTTYVEATKRNMPEQFLADLPLSHNAVEDAVMQGELFERLLSYRRSLNQDE